MLAWFIGMSVVIVWRVFGDTAIDYRLVMAGAVVPDLIDLTSGGAWLGHTLLASVVLLTAVMAFTRGRRRRRRQLLALPIGTFLHLLLDGVWAGSNHFWWPLRGSPLDGGQLPSFGRPLVAAVLMEVAGLVALVWWWRRFRLHEPPRRNAFLRTGRLGRDLVS